MEFVLSSFKYDEDSQVGKVGLPPRVWLRIHKFHSRLHIEHVEGREGGLAPAGLCSYSFSRFLPISADHSAAALASFCTSSGHHHSLSTFIG